MMASIRHCVRSTTQQWRTLRRLSQKWERGCSWLSLISSQPIARSRSILKTAPFKQCVGKARRILTPCFHSAHAAPKIFNAVADALNWHLQVVGSPLIRHYLDDYIIITPPDRVRCRELITILHHECSRLGMPIAAQKYDGRTTCITFLGIEIDTVSGQLWPPRDKLDRLQLLLEEWRQRKHCNRKQMESLIGLLNHACKVVRLGRSFLRRMIDLLHTIHHPRHSKVPIRLNKGFRSDLAWWSAFVGDWNGMSFLHTPDHLPEVKLFTDASGNWGCGAVHDKSWFQFPWDTTSQALAGICTWTVYNGLHYSATRFPEIWARGQGW